MTHTEQNQIAATCIDVAIDIINAAYISIYGAASAEKLCEDAREALRQAKKDILQATQAIRDDSAIGRKSQEVIYDYLCIARVSALRLSKL